MMQEKIYKDGFIIPITAHAILLPACPVVRLSGNPPRPKSSTPSWMTTERPSMEYFPERWRVLSTYEK